MIRIVPDERKKMKHKAVTADEQHPQNDRGNKCRENKKKKVNSMTEEQLKQQRLKKALDMQKYRSMIFEL